MRSLLSLVSLAAPVMGLVRFEELPQIPHGWSAVGNVQDSTEVKLHAALKYQNLDRLEAELAAVSTPCSPLYGKYQDLNNQWGMFAPSNISESKVKDWLQKSGAKDIKSDGQTVSFKTTVRNAKTMMDADFQVYKRGNEAKLRTRVDDNDWADTRPVVNDEQAYSIPEDLNDHIDLISPTIYFGDLKPHAVIPEKISMDSLEEKAKRDDLEQQVKRDYLQPSCLTTWVSKSTNRIYEAITPQCLKELYNTKGYSADQKSGSNIAFANFLEQSPSHSDLFLFEKEFNIPKQDFEILALINGGVNDQNPLTETDGEANLDVQNIAGLVDGLPIYTYITGGRGPLIPDLLSPNQSTDSNEPYLEYFSYLLAQPNSKIPYVLSHSYGDHENTIPEKYATRICNMAGMLGLRGRSVLFSSGDEGTGAVCRSNRPPGNLYGHPEFTPQFPSTCPYVTAVGGTQAYNPEIAWNASSGGFSRYFPTAFYQKSAVETYLDKYINPVAKEYYSTNNYTDFGGRGVPDVSAHSLYPYYLLYINGSRTLSGGTSAAAPVFSSIVALLNDARFRAGKPALGFLNPWLYSSASSLDDITGGIVLGCGGIDLQSNEPIPGAGIIPYASWNSTVGWDPATGLGTPDFQAMKTSALSGCPGRYGNGWSGGWHHGGGGW